MEHCRGGHNSNFLEGANHDNVEEWLLRALGLMGLMLMIGAHVE
jgi:hypothetical protein